MSLEFRIALFVGAVLMLAYFLFQIHKSRMQIDYAIFWGILGVFFVFLSVFPNVIIYIASLLGIQSPANLLYLLLLCILIFKQFTITIKLSKMDRQISDLTQSIALKEMNLKESNAVSCSAENSDERICGKTLKR